MALLIPVENAIVRPLPPHRRSLRAIAAPGQNRTLYWFSKRAVDVAGAAWLLVLLAPLLLLITLLIRLSSPGPAIYRQERVGSRRRRLKGATTWEIRPFQCYKFRTMYCDADQSPHQQYVRAFCRGEILEEKKGTRAFKLNNDSRVTPLGRILRQTSLDELPQLVNVLKGDMSLVGPRPVPPYEVAHYQQIHYGRFLALQGISGLWQVKGRGIVPFEEMMRMDMDYAQQCSLWLDLKILLLTIPIVILRRGAK